MATQYICSLLTVKDINKSKKFYKNVLNQEIELDHGENVSFSGGFAIHDRDHFKNLINKPISGPQNNIELYFESEDMESIQSKLKLIGVSFLHEIFEQPWGQRVMRFYDPDNYIIEIGEPIEFTIVRFFKDGLSAEQIVQRTSMPLNIVKTVIKSLN
ncbi:VOC family protein [Methanobacterium alcaliphilum]|uniref:VOC family protein n=1 Tax=Methanobacterium alcaliphilum TaxID=392018 RepID=UPI00200A71CC|nr:VOC family protein [Methanobacterium alcaliphilum]MCK9151277.1 VOC family protein [Methanobacterium alcaliphilum]